MRGAAARARFLAAVAALILPACGQQQAPHADPAALPTSDLKAPVPAHALAPALAPDPPRAGESDKGPEGARAVLRAWGRALEGRNYDAAYARWGAEAQARSGMNVAEHRQRWSQFKTINVGVQAGEMEGAAGSSFYTAPIAIVGKLRNGRPYRLEGAVTLRRVDDVDGATPDQLHWHIEKVDLKPVV